MFSLHLIFLNNILPWLGNMVVFRSSSIMTSQGSHLVCEPARTASEKGEVVIMLDQTLFSYQSALHRSTHGVRDGSHLVYLLSSQDLWELCVASMLLCCKGPAQRKHNILQYSLLVTDPTLRAGVVQTQWERWISDRIVTTFL